MTFIGIMYYACLLPNPDHPDPKINPILMPTLKPHLEAQTIVCYEDQIKCCYFLKILSLCLKNEHFGTHFVASSIHIDIQTHTNEWATNVCLISDLVNDALLLQTMSLYCLCPTFPLSHLVPRKENDVNGRTEVEVVWQWGVKDKGEFIDCCMEMEQKVITAARRSQVIIWIFMNCQRSEEGISIRYCNHQ